MFFHSDSLSSFGSQVNGYQVSLPFILKNEISVYVAGDSVVIEKKSVLRLSYSVSHDITVTVGEAVASHVCGACGKLDANSKLDPKKESIQHYINTWEAPDFEFGERLSD